MHGESMDLFNMAFLHSQVFWTGVSFCLLLIVMAWKVLPAITAALDERADKIRTDLTSAEESRRKAELSLAAYEEKLAKAKDEAASIINIARVEAKNLVDERLKELDEEMSRKRDDAAKSIDAARASAMKDLQAQVATLTVQVTEKLLAESLDAKKAEALTSAAIKDLAN